MASPQQLDRLVDESEVRRVRQVWAFARDHGEWATMAACFHPDATILVSWYEGPAAQFFERTMAMAAERAPEERSKHWFGNARVTLNRDRALLETDLQLVGRERIDGQLFDFTTWGRFLDRVERRQGAWKILRMTCIYDKDRMDPVVPGTVPTAFYDAVTLHGPESGFAFMRFRQEKRGRVVPPGIVIGGSAGERALRADAQAWLAAG